MKLLSILIASVLPAQLCIAQAVKKNSLSIEHLKGKVKRVEWSSFTGNPIDGKIDTLAPHKTNIDLYDENGNDIEDSYFGKDGLLLLKWVKQYNGKGEETEENYKKNEVLESTTFFKYDERGNLVESGSKYIADNTSDRILYKYDDKGKNVEVDVLNKGDSLRYKDIYKYDTNGNRIEMDYWRAKEDTMREKWTFSYNDAGTEVQERRYTPSGVLDAENNFTYENFDRLGNWQKKTSTSKALGRPRAKIWYIVTFRKIYYY